MSTLKQTNGHATRRTLLIDTDAGLDDAQAVLMALNHQSVNVISITTTHGNADVKQVGLNVLRILKVADKIDIPVYLGCSSSILGTCGDSSFYHGKDGLGDAPDKDAPGAELLQSKHAVQAIIDAAHEYAGELEVVCIGPLTNLALALRMEEGLGKLLKHCYIMGGNTQGVGNITVAAEYNFHTDPEAAKIVLAEIGCPVSLVGWETCRDQALPWTFLDQMDGQKSKQVRFLKQIYEKIRKTSEKVGEEYITCDEVIMAYLLDPSVATKTVHHYVTVNTEGDLLRGQMVVDWNNTLKKKPNCTIVLKTDVEKYKTMLIDATK